MVKKSKRSASVKAVRLWDSTKHMLVAAGILDGRNLAPRKMCSTSLNELFNKALQFYFASGGYKQLLAVDSDKIKIQAATFDLMSMLEKQAYYHELVRNKEAEIKKLKEIGEQGYREREEFREQIRQSRLTDSQLVIKERFPHTPSKETKVTDQ